MPRACSQARADGATLTTRSRRLGSRAQGTACSRPGGTTIDRPAAKLAGRRAEQDGLEGVAARLDGGQRARLAGPATVGEPAQAEPGKFDLAGRIVRAAGGPVPDPARPAHQNVQVTVDRDDLHQARVAEPVKQQPAPNRHRPPRPSPWALSTRARTAASRRSCSRWKTRVGSPCDLARSSRLVTSRSAVRSAWSSPSSAGRADGTACAVARHRSLQASSSLGRPDSQGGPLRQRSQFGAVRGGLGPEFGCAQAEPVLIENGEAAAAGRQQPSPVTGHVGAQRLGEPPLGAGQRGSPVAPDQRGCGEVPVGFAGPAQGTGKPARQQSRLHRGAGADRVQVGGDLLAVPEQPGGCGARGTVCLQQQQSRVRPPPAAPLGSEHAPGGPGPRGGQFGFPGGERGPGCAEQQLRSFCGPGPAAREAADRGVGLREGVGRAARRPAAPRSGRWRGPACGTASRS